MSLRLYPPVRPQSVSEVLDTAFQILAASLLQTLPYGILMILAGQLGNIYNLTTGRPLGPQVPHDAPSTLVYIVSILAAFTLWTALFLRQRAIARGEPYTMRAELTCAVRTLPTLVPLALATAGAVAVGMVLLILPGVYLMVALSMALPALVLASKGPIEAMKFSIQLVRGHWWRTLGIFAVTAIIVIVFYVLAIALVAIAVQFARGADIALVTAAATVLIIALSAFVTPLVAAMVLAVFGDLEVRHAAAPGF